MSETSRPQGGGVEAEMTDKWLDAAALDRMVSQDRHDEDDYLALFAQAREALRLRARLSEAERERDEARKEAEAWETGGRMAPVSIAIKALEAQQKTERALAFSQAQVAALREAARDVVEAVRGTCMSDEELLDDLRYELAQPHDNSALREFERATIERCAKVCEAKVRRESGYGGQWEGYGSFDGDMTGPECAAALRALPEPQDCAR